MMTKRSGSRRLTLLHADQMPVLMRRMLTTGFGVHRRNVMREDDGSCTESTAAGNPVRHIHHHAYACWDSEETRHFYEDILGMPLIATVVIEDPLRKRRFKVLSYVFRD